MDPFGKKDAGHRRAPLVLAPVLVGLASVAGCAALGEDDDAAQRRGDAAATEEVPSSTTTRAEDRDQDRREDPDGLSTAGGRRADAAGLEVVPEVVAEVQPSVVAVLAGQGEGSGVVYSPDGVIVTNAHVVEGRDEVVVAFADGDRVDARVVATDPRSDLAVLRVDEEDLPAATFAEGLPTVGELAIAMGNPLGFENTATAGIVSGLGRSIPGAVAAGEVALIDLIQTDAAISPGNSGGALVDGQGRVIGVNVAYIPPAGGAVNLGFAIPSPVVLDVVDELLADGRASYPFLGVGSRPLTPDIAEKFGLGREEGVIVFEVTPGSPADRAGVRPGDVVVGLGGDEVRSQEDFLARLREHEPGEEVELRVAREEDEEQQLAVTLAERPGA